MYVCVVFMACTYTAIMFFVFLGAAEVSQLFAVHQADATQVVIVIASAITPSAFLDAAEASH